MRQLAELFRDSDLPALTTQGRARDSWIVWFERVHVFSAGLAVVLFVANLLFSERGPLLTAVGIGLTGLLAVWTWHCLFRDRTFRRPEYWRPGLFLVVALPIYIALAVIDPSYHLLFFLAYWQMFSLLPLGRAIATSAVFTITNIWSQQGFPWELPLNSWANWAFFGFSVGFSGLMAMFITGIIRQSSERQALVNELESTRAELATSEREAGVMEERQRLAGEVHDTIAQDFTSIVMQLEAAETRLADDPDLARHIAIAKQTARDGLAESRRIVHALRPDILNTTTLERALGQFADRWSRETMIPVAFQTSGDTMPLRRDLDVVLFRGLQESLANVRKHTTATKVDITLSYLGDEVILDIGDNGVGFDPERDNGGVGLATMRERAGVAGGAVIVESTPGDGTTVSISIPWSDEAEEPVSHG